jgi:glucan 1,3-beta-glucosidase
VVYFPAGTYSISSSIIPYYFTMLIGDATSPPTLKATANFKGFGLIDGDPYWSSDLNWVSVNNFYRQIRNLVIDTTAVAPGTACTGIHWPTSQATSLQNVKFNMPIGNGVVHVGLFIGQSSLDILELLSSFLFIESPSSHLNLLPVNKCNEQSPGVVVSCPT